MGGRGDSAMKDPNGNRVLGKTRWRRFGLAYGVSMGVIMGVLLLAATGAIALPLTITGQPFTLHGSALHATNFTQYGDVDLIGGNPANPVGVAVTVIGSLDDGGGNGIVNLTQTVCGPTGLPGSFSHLLLTITGDTVTANNLVADVTDLTTSANMTTTFSNLTVGAPVGTREGSTTFGQTADSFDITRSDASSTFAQTAVYTKAGTFAVKNLGLHATLTGTCP